MPSRQFSLSCKLFTFLCKNMKYNMIEYLMCYLLGGILVSQLLFGANGLYFSLKANNFHTERDARQWTWMRNVGV